MTSTTLRLILILLGAMAPLAANAAPLCSVTPTGDPSTITTGIVYQAYTVSCPESVQGGPAVAAKTGNMHLVTVTLTTPGLSVRTSVPDATVEPPLKGVGGIFTVAPTSAVFAVPIPDLAGGTAGPQIAVNANLFTICCTTTVPPPSGKARTRLRGMEIAGGKVFVPPLANAKIGGSIPYATFASSLIIDQSNLASIWTPGMNTIFPSAVTTAVTGSHLLVRGGTIAVPVCNSNYPCSAGNWLGPNARTGVGLNGPSSLVMVVADGVDNAEGLSLYQFADVFAQVATAAINLDGGGSSTMVRRSGARGFTILNQLGGAERDVGSVLYIMAP
jgi:hypothetical protein